MTPLLSVENVTVAFARGITAVDQVSLTVARGETVGLVGESGSGKTTIGRAALGLVPVTSGRIVLDGAEIGNVAVTARGRLASRLQMVFQDHAGSLNPARTVGYSVAEPARAAGGSASAAGVRARELLTAVGLPAEAAARYPREFSGGQRQRIVIGRALAASPDLVVCDEPTSSLDLSTQAQMLNLLTSLRAERGLSYLFISHDLAVVRHMADRIVVLYQGRVMEDGPAGRVSASPLHPYTRALRAAAPVADPAAQQLRREERHILIRPAAGPVRLSPQSCPFTPRCPGAAPVCASARPREVTVGAVRVACHRYDPASGHPDQVDLAAAPGSNSDTATNTAAAKGSA
jgi:oligopeptide/dipeptide ABC transporter ATP-binding protein